LLSNKVVVAKILLPTSTLSFTDRAMLATPDTWTDMVATCLVERQRSTRVTVVEPVLRGVTASALLAGV